MRIVAAIAVVATWCWMASGQEGPAVKQDGPRFVVIDLMVDSGSEPLAAYQADIVAIKGAVKIVGVEGGEHVAFARPPYYDPAAMQHEHVVLAAFSTAEETVLPRGLVRVASVHCLVSGEGMPAFTARVIAAASSGGRKIPVQFNVKERRGR